MVEQFICSKQSTLVDVWKLINENAKGVAFITDNLNKLVGVVTDGDIRRFLLNGGTLVERIDCVMNVNFIYASIDDSHKSLLGKINDDAKIIPLVNNNFEVVDYFEYRANLHIPIAAPDLKGNEFDYLMDAFLSTWISSSGEYIDRFETDFPEFCETKYGVAVSNGTVALHLAMVTLGIGAGDEVIVPDLTFAATINTVIHANATPVIVDIERSSWCIDPEEIEKAITPRTKAIIPVHLYGQPCDMDKIMAIARKHNLFVIEDCAEAHGAEYNGRKVGSFGDISCFSFYGNKIITTGEGGMCITNSEVNYEKMRVLRDHGMSKTKRYWHTAVGYNYRMTNLQAAIGVAQIERIHEILDDRRNIENQFVEKLKNIPGISFQRSNLEKRKKITWLVCALFEQDKLKTMEILSKNGIDTRSFFFPLSEMDIYKEYVFSNAVSVEISAKGLNFPTSGGTDDKVVDKIFNILTNI